jgi:predicted nucleic acid-binding protein
VSYLLDTNVLGEIRKKRPDPAVAAWYAGVDDDELFLSVLVVGEIQQGVTRLQKRDPRQAAVFEVWLKRLQREFADRVLPVSQDVALEWGRLSAGDPLPVIDGLLAATALVHGLTVVTRNVDDFGPTGVPVLNPFESQG